MLPLTSLETPPVIAVLAMLILLSRIRGPLGVRVMLRVLSSCPVSARAAGFERLHALPRSEAFLSYSMLFK